MPTTFRTQIVGQVFTTDVQRDWMTNVLWHIAPTASANVHGDAVLAAFLAHADGYQYFQNLWVKVYDHANPLHSPPVYTAHSSGGGALVVGPRNIALCLSFFSGLNVRGQRGRIYLGPIQNTRMGEYAPTTLLTSAIALGQALLHVGAADTGHVIHHSKTDTFSNVSNYFVNNRWDTMRSRLPKETSRVTYP
jgi:hypothetical protein